MKSCKTNRIRLCSSVMRSLVASILLVCLTMGGCKIDNSQKEKKFQVVTTIFPYYDLVRVITAGDADTAVSMLVPAGKDSHSFEPTIQDMLGISSANLLIYNSDVTEHWITKVKESAKNDQRVDLAVADSFSLDKHEHEEHEHEEEDEEGHEYEDHVWTSPKRMILITGEICEALCRMNPECTDLYEKNADAYCKKLQALSEQLEKIVEESACKTLIFGDRFPFYYLCKDYGLTAYAAFDGCSSETEPSAGVMSELIVRIRDQNIPVVYYLEMSSQKIADTLCKETGARKLLLHSCHTITTKELQEGASYLSLMEQNLENIKAGLEGNAS